MHPGQRATHHPNNLRRIGLDGTPVEVSHNDHREIHHLLFDFVMLPAFGGPALPLASVLATLLQLGLALEVLRDRFLVIGRSAFVPLLWRVAICTLIMNACGLGMLYWVSGLENSLDIFSYRLLKVVLPVAVAVVVYAGGLFAVGLSPLKLMNEPHLPDQAPSDANGESKS